MILGYAASLVVLKFGYPILMSMVGWVIDLIRAVTRGRLFGGVGSATFVLLARHSLYGVFIGLATATVMPHLGTWARVVVILIGAISLISDISQYTLDLMEQARSSMQVIRFEDRELLMSLILVSQRSLVPAFALATLATVFPGIVLAVPGVSFLAIVLTAVLQIIQ